jgi:hypothetical protein
VIGVELVRPLDMGAPPPKYVNESNLAVFLHRPVFALVAGKPDITLKAKNAGPPPTWPLEIRVRPPAQPGQDVQVLLNDSANPAGPGYTFPGTVGTTPATDPLKFTLTDVASATYLVRVRVDGAETPLDVDANGKFTGPTIVVA